ncbi:unnamed protein product [Closterium sp. Yama58-4]|nr:unnamed protein product [Closterium sp. Yama58-4]
MMLYDPPAKPAASNTSSAKPGPFQFAFRRVAATIRLFLQRKLLTAARTIGPVHRTCIAARAVYVVRTGDDHGPIQNSYAASLQDEAVMAMECNIKDILQRIIIEIIKSLRI